jgi:hypothetical protein
MPERRAKKEQAIVEIYRKSYIMADSYEAISVR